MSIYTPFFYIIQHNSGLLYAGCKFGKDSNVETFMKPNGYHTSSKSVHKLISEDGLESFKTVFTLLETDISPMTVYEFETEFLTTNQIASNSAWINAHNNRLAPFGSQEFQQMMQKIHGVSHGMQIEETKRKMSETVFEKHGYEFITQVPEFIEKAIRSKNIKYGNGNNYDAIKTTILARYGVENISQTELHRKSFVATCQEKYGTDHYMQSDSFKEEYKRKLYETQGYENNFQRPDVIEKVRAASIERNSDPEYKKLQSQRITDALRDVDRKGENNSFYGKQHSDETRAKISESKKGSSFSKFTCIECRKVLGVNNLTQHFKKCV